MPGDVNHIVDTTHDEQISIFIKITAVAGDEISRVGFQVTAGEAFAVTPDAG